MKITASQLRRIIKEEVKRAKRVNLHENPLAMVDSDLGNALTDAVKDAISNTVALRHDIDANVVKDSLNDMEISSVIEDMVGSVADYLSEQGILLSDDELKKFKKGDVIKLNQDHELVIGISGNEEKTKFFPAETRFMVTYVSPDDEPGGVTYEIQQMTKVDPKKSRQKKVPGGSLSGQRYWIFPEDEEFFDKIETIR